MTMGSEPSILVHPVRDGAGFRVRARPGAAKTRTTGVHGGALRIDVAAPPEDGRANAELIRFLAHALEVPTTSMSLVAGAASRGKTVRVAGIKVDVLSTRLRKLIDQENKS